MFYSGLSWHNFHVAPTCKSSLRDRFTFTVQKKIFAFTPSHLNNHKTTKPHLLTSPQYPFFLLWVLLSPARPGVAPRNRLPATQAAGDPGAQPVARAQARDPGRRRPRRATQAWGRAAWVAGDLFLGFFFFF